MATKIQLKVTAIADDCFVMPKLDKEQLSSLNHNELKVLLYFAAQARDVDKAATELAIASKELKEIIKKLGELDYISTSEETVKRVKKHSSNYDGEDIADAIERDSNFKMLAEYTAANLEKQLNRNDLNTLYDLYDFYGMSSEFICGIVDFAVSSNKRHMSFIFNAAVTINAEGINSFDALDKYLDARRKADSMVARFKKLCGIGTRELSEKEKRYTERWFGEMRLSFDLVKTAYERTVDNTGEFSMPYMSKILEQWYAKGIRTPDDVAVKDVKPAAQAKNNDDIEELFAAAAKKGKLKKTE